MSEPYVLKQCCVNCSSRAAKARCLAARTIACDGAAAVLRPRGRPTLRSDAVGRVAEHQAEASVASIMHTEIRVRRRRKQKSWSSILFLIWVRKPKSGGNRCSTAWVRKIPWFTVSQFRPRSIKWLAFLDAPNSAISSKSRDHGLFVREHTTTS
eukprot:6182000-Pleurochrysis_carterae.AAC.7